MALLLLPQLLCAAHGGKRERYCQLDGRLLPVSLLLGFSFLSKGSQALSAAAWVLLHKHPHVGQHQCSDTAPHSKAQAAAAGSGLAASMN